jgi:ATP-dependent DNA helicase DinG
MGKVIQIAEATPTRVASTDPVLTFIDECYARLAKLPNFIVRDEQRQLSKAIARAIIAGEPIAAEAPTGTGKTLAYLIGAVAAAERLRTVKDVPIVVATATVGLQSQILLGDLPKLFAAGILNESDAVLAKGRGRYFCVANAERLTEGKNAASQFDFFDEAANSDVAVLEEVREMLEAWYGRAWAGDSDSYTGTPPTAWNQVQATADTCVGHKCDHYSSCPFFNARRALSSAKVIVANHDLVLSDLAMAREGMDPLFPGGRYIVVFDEAHHLPDKALDIGTASLKLGEILQDLPRLAGYGRSWHKSVDLVRVLKKAKLEEGDFDPAFLTNALLAVRDEAAQLPVDGETMQYRFVRGEMPPTLTTACEQALDHALRLSRALGDATQALKGSNVAEKFPELKPNVSELLFQSAFFNSLLNKVVKALTLLTAHRRAVRWAFNNGTEVSLHNSPLEGADVLRDLLWGNERAMVAMVSATLKDFDGFERFKARCGAGDALRTMELPHIFPYRENTMYLVQMQNSPRHEEKKAYTAELIASMPGFINPAEGTLVLFPSRSLMRLMLPTLRAKFGNRVLAQGDMGIKELIAEHRRRRDAGEGSILCGLATLAEGLDLPGHYCTHVIICALPFTVPTSPVEQELQEMMGRDYFALRAMPDALVRLVQMVGRLMRRESDRGRITVFDKRLFYTRWGRRMLDALPDFRRKPVAPDAPPPFVVS